jgi:hypothetical protein
MRTAHLSQNVPTPTVPSTSFNAKGSKSEVFAPSISAVRERYAEDPKLPSQALLSDPAIPQLSRKGSYTGSNVDVNQPPHMATLSVPGSGQKTAPKKRAGTFPWKSTPQLSYSGQNIVVCRSCRGTCRTPSRNILRSKHSSVSS